VRYTSSQFVLFFGTLLAFLNASPVFAGFISVPALLDGPSSEPFQNHNADWSAEEKSPSRELNSSGKSPQSEPTRSTFTHEQTSLLSATSHSVVQQPSRGADSNRLSGNDNSQPGTPRPSAPSGGGGASGAGGTAIANGSKEQQNALPTDSMSRRTEWGERERTCLGRFNFGPMLSGIFRPPRAHADTDSSHARPR
jgi:hypothetical protein